MLLGHGPLGFQQTRCGSPPAALVLQDAGRSALADRISRQRTPTNDSQYFPSAQERHPSRHQAREGMRSFPAAPAEALHEATFDEMLTSWGLSDPTLRDAVAKQCAAALARHGRSKSA